MAVTPPLPSEEMPHPFIIKAQAVVTMTKQNIYNGENDLKKALKKTYNTANKQSNREFSPSETGIKRENFEQVKSIVIATAHDHIA